jgi:2-keto-4-pentenoate hydratase
MRAQLELRRARLAAGERPLGWKLGFGAPAALERLALAAPLVGFLLRSSLVPDGGVVSVGGWTRPVGEAEVAVHLVRDVPSGATRDEAAAAIGALGSAIELADVDRPPDDVEQILAGNIFQRAVVLGRPDPGRAGGSTEGLAGRVVVDGREVGATDEVEALTGDLLALVAHVGSVLPAFGATLRAGDVVIAGSIVPPFDVAPGHEIRFELSPLADVAVRLQA